MAYVSLLPTDISKEDGSGILSRVSGMFSQGNHFGEQQAEQVEKSLAAKEVEPSPMEESPPVAPPTLPTPPQPPKEDLKAVLPPNLQTLFSGNLEASSNLPMGVRALVSSIKGPGGPILKFSELFAPPTPLDSFVPKKKQKLSPTGDLEDLYESDDEEAHELYFGGEEDGVGGLDRPSSRGEDGELMAQPMKSQNQQPRIVPASVSLEAIQQKTWEDKIRWGREGNDDPNSKFVYTLHEVPPHKGLWGELQAVAKRPPAPPQDLPQRPRNEDLATHTLNPDLETGKWLGSVVWDTDVSDAALANTSLILDLNDKRVFPDGPTKAFSKAPVASFTKDMSSSSKKRKVDKLDEEVDKFNLSNDAYYRNARGSKSNQKLAKTKVLHSEPALKLSLVKTHLTKEDLANFHRPSTRLQPGEHVKVHVVQGDEFPESSSNRVEAMRHKGDLSGKDSRVVLMEYVEEHPSVVMNLGMGTKVRNYYRKKNASENPLLRFEDGENVLLEKTDESVFLGDVEPGKMVQALDNNLFRAPIFKHAVAETDFLIVRSGRRAYIREIPAVYTVGQTQPKMEVYAPNSRAANNYIKNRLQAYIYRLFMKKSTQHRLKISDIMNLFPGNSETSIRKRLKDCADFQRGGDDSGWWTVKDQSQLPNEDELRSMVTPEHVCLYESMLAGQYRLQAAGVTRFTSTSPSFTAALQQLDEQAQIDVKRAAHALEEELLLTPWNLTSNFVNAMQGKGLLQLTGLGDPSGGRGEAFSYLKMPQKGMTKRSAKEKDMASKTQVTGTDADLRKLSLENARLVLLKFGVPEDHIQRLTRWERIALVRQKSSEAAAAGESGMTKFARGARYSMQQQHVQHQEQIQMIFDNQIRSLSDPNPEFSDDEADEEFEEEFEDFGKDLETMLDTESKKRKRSQEQEEQAEREEYEKLMKEEIFGDKDKSSGNLNQKFALSQEGEGSRRFLKRTVTTKNPDGTKSERVEIITDPQQIEACLAREKERKHRLGIPRRLKQHLSPEEEEERNKIRREKRRLQEQLRRLRRNKEKQEELKEKLSKGSDNSDDPNASLKFKCGVCGLVGHMRTNRNCPLYVEPTEPALPTPDSPPDINPEQIKVEGSKLKFPREALRANPSSQLIVRIKKQDIPLVEDDEEFAARNRENAKRRRRTGTSGAQVALSNLIEKVLNKIKSHPYAHPFIKPVPNNNKIAPDYYKVITNPIDLSMIRSRIREFRYGSRQDFLDDIKLMVENCYTYNSTRNPHLLPMADALYQIAETAFDESEPEISELEKVLKPDDQAENDPNAPKDATPLPPPVQHGQDGHDEEVDVMF